MKKVGYTTVRALSVGGAFGDLRDDWDHLTNKEKLWLDILPWFIVLPAVILLVVTFILGGTTVHVSARTEHLTYTPLYSDPPVWILKDAEFQSNDFNETDISIDFFDSDEKPSTNNIIRHFNTNSSDSQANLINGFLQLSCGDRVTVSRVGSSRIKVDVDTINGAIITDEVGNILQFDNSLPNAFFFYPHSRSSISKSTDSSDFEPISYVWAMEGQIIPSRPAGIDTLTTQGLMLSGRVDLLNRRVIGGGNYLVDSHELELGDHLVLSTAKDTENERDNVLREGAKKPDPTTEETTSKLQQQSDLCEKLRPDDKEFKSWFVDGSATDKGFIHIDEEKGMALSLISNAKSVEIVRYRSTAVNLERSVLKRLQNDKVFAIGWSVLLFTFFLMQKLKRAYIMSRGRQEKLHYADAESSSADSTEQDQEPAASTKPNVTNPSTDESADSSNLTIQSSPSSSEKDSDSSND